MGLDNGFLLRSKKHEGFEVELAYFRKFYELDDWCTRRCKRVSDYEVLVTEDDLIKLKEEISPIVKELQKLDEGKLLYYEENGFPKKYTTQFYGQEFDPTSSRSYCAGWKTLHLFHCIDCMLDIMQHNYDIKDDIYIVFYSSF